MKENSSKSGLIKNEATISRVDGIIARKDSCKVEDQFMEENSEVKEQKFPKNAVKKWFKGAILISAIFVVSVLLFLKFNLNGAAVLTDNVLRPLIGDQKIIYLEKIFFNASDTFQRFTTNQNGLSAPKFEDGAISGNIAGANLDTNKLEINSAFKPLEGEGVWRDWPLSAFPGKEILAYTFVRSDPDRPYSITTLVQADMHALNMGSVAGIKQPGGPIGMAGPGKVPRDIAESGRLVAAFDGGFQYKDGQFGMIVNDTTYLPLKNDLGTLIGYKDGNLKIVDYQGQDLGNNIAFVRQNCPILIQDGEVAAADPRNKTLWGRLAAGTVDIFTWRSGIGLTANGNLLFAAGNNLTPVTLANALKMAGAVNAIQLDINPIWVRFNIFDKFSGGKYVSTPLTKDLHDGASAYLNGYDKDFFYLYQK